jgi:LPS-assembly protein
VLRRFVLLCLTLVAARLAGADAGLNITADTTIGSLEKDGRATWQGHAIVRGEDLMLTADAITYALKEETLTAVGRVVFTRAGARMLADRLVFHRREGRFAAENIRLGSPPYFAEGASAEGTREEITIRQARVSYGEPGPWEPTVVAEVITLSPGRHVRTEKATAGIGHLQPLSLPRLEQRFGRPFPGSVSLDGGFRRSLGAFADARLLAPVAPGVNLGGDVGVFTARGFLVGPGARYEAPDDPDRLRGYFRSGYINDHGDKKTDVHLRPISEHRAYAEWQHQQQLGERITLHAQLNWWKDSDILRDFRPRSFFPVQEPDTFVEAVSIGTNHLLSLFSRLQPNSFQRVQERLPELRFDGLPFLSAGGIYQRFQGSFAVLREDPVLTGSTRRSDRLDAYYSATRPLTHADWLAFTPVLGGRLTHYATSDTGGARVGNYLRLLGEVGADALVRLSGTSDYRNPQWKIDGLRHLLTPRLGYRYIPQADKGRRVIPRIDRETFATYLPPLGLGDTRHLDDLQATNVLRVGLDNTLQTRDPSQGSRDLLECNVAGDFRFRRQPGERAFAAVHTELAARPARWLQFDLYQSFTPQSFTLRELNSGLTLRDGTVWSLRLGNNFLRRDLEDYSADLRTRINERFETVARVSYDTRRHRFTEQTYGVAQNLGNTWLVTYSVSVYSGRKRESNFGFDLRIDALRF